MRAPTDHETAVLDAIVEVARPILLTEFNPDSCISSTRIGLDVLAYFGIAAREMALSALLFNPEAADLLNTGTSMEDLRAAMWDLSPEEPGGPWTVGIGFPAAGTRGRPNGWSGHLVAALPEVGAVLDLSVDQGSRPHKNMPVAPFWAVIDDPDWWADPAGSPVHVLVTPQGTTLVLDRRVLDPTGYRAAPNWKRVSRGAPRGLFRDLTGQIIREVRARLP